MRNSKSRAKPHAQLPDHKTYELGHGKPPLATQFKPGTSGNPKGRPKGKKSAPVVPEHQRMKSIILDEAYRTIKVNDGAKQVTVPMAQAIIRSIAVTAAKGNTRAQRLFSEQLANTELANKQADDEWLETMITYKSEWETELERRKALSITHLADPLPHPDDVIIDYRRNTVVVKGPMDRQELAKLDLWLTRKDDAKAELEFLCANREGSENQNMTEFLEGEIAQNRRILELVNTALSLQYSPACIERRTLQLKINQP